MTIIFSPKENSRMFVTSADLSPFVTVSDRGIRLKKCGLWELSRLTLDIVSDRIISSGQSVEVWEGDILLMTKIARKE